MATPTPWFELIMNINKLEYNLNNTLPIGEPTLNQYEKNVLIKSLYKTINRFEPPEDQRIINQKIRLAQLILQDLTQTPLGSSDPAIESNKCKYIEELLKSSGFMQEGAKSMINKAENVAALHLAAATSIRQPRPFSPTHDIPSFYGSGPGQTPDAARTVTRGSISGHQPPVQAGQLPPAGFNPRQYRPPVGTVIPRRPSSQATTDSRLPPPIPGVPARRTHDERPQVLSGGNTSRALPLAGDIRGPRRAPPPPPTHLIDNPPVGRPQDKRVQFELDKNAVYPVPSRRNINQSFEPEHRQLYKEPGSGSFREYEGRKKLTGVFDHDNYESSTIPGRPEMQGAKTAHTRSAKHGETVPESRLSREQTTIEAKYRAAAERILFLVADTGQIPTILGQHTQSELGKLSLDKEPDHGRTTDIITNALKKDYPTLQDLSTVIEFKHGDPIKQKPRR